MGKNKHTSTHQIHVMFRFSPRSRCNSSSRCCYRARVHVDPAWSRFGLLRCTYVRIHEVLVCSDGVWCSSRWCTLIPAHPFTYHCTCSSTYSVQHTWNWTKIILGAHICRSSGTYNTCEGRQGRTSHCFGRKICASHPKKVKEVRLLKHSDAYVVYVIYITHDFIFYFLFYFSPS